MEHGTRGVWMDIKGLVLLTRARGLVIECLLMHTRT